MHRTPGDLRNEHHARLTPLAEQRPEWRTWLRLLRSAAAELGDEWYDPADDESPDPQAAPQAPLLSGRTLRVDAERARNLLGRLMADAAADGAAAARSASPDAVALLQAVVCCDREALDRLAGAVDLSPAVLDAVGRFLALPLLDACARAQAARLPSHWPHGYCPVCGGRAGLAELSGLEGLRRLRCDRCGTAWSAGWLSCAHCGERDHERLGALVEEGEEATAPRKVETCRSCRGYLKAFNTLRPATLLELWLRDLETVELDVVALERGYVRPDGPGHGIDVRIVAGDGGVR